MSLAERSRRVPLALRLSLILAAVGLPVYWGITYAGPYRWIAELQLSWFGSYRVILTGALTMLALFVPVVVAIQLLASAFAAGAARGAAARDVGGPDVAEVNNFLRRNRGYLVGALLSVALLGVGGYAAIKWLGYGGHADVSVASLERGEQPSSRWVTLHGGHLLWRRAVGMRSGRAGSIVERYIPLVSTRWRAGDPVHVYLELYASWVSRYRSALEGDAHPGTLSHESLPGVIRSELTQRLGHDPHDYWVLDYRDSPHDAIAMAESFAAMGLFVGVIVALVWLVRRRKRA